MNIPVKNPIFSLGSKWGLKRPTLKKPVFGLVIYLALALSTVAAQSPSEPVITEFSPSEPAINVVPVIKDLQLPQFESVVEPPPSAKNRRSPTTTRVPVARSFELQLVNEDLWSVRANHEFLRSEPAVFVALSVKDLRKDIKIIFNWYQADGRRFSQGETWLSPALSGRVEEKIKIKGNGVSVMLGSYKVEVSVETASGATVYENQIEFEIVKDPTDPGGQSLVQEAITSQDKPNGVEKTLFTFTDEQVFASIVFEYYQLEIDSAVGFKVEWYYDEESVINHPVLGMVGIPSPFQSATDWTDEIEPPQYLDGLASLLNLPSGIDVWGVKLKGKWHVDFLIKTDRGDDSEWELAASLPFTIDNEPPVVKITEPEDGYETEKANLELLAGTATDNIGVVDVAWNKGDTSGAASGTDTWQVNNIPLHDGDNFITVTASDAAENKGKKTIKVIFNNSPPEVSVVEGSTVATINELYSLSLHVSDIN